MVPEFQGRNLVIATMHGKDRVMRSLLEQSLGVHVHVTQKLNTDALGTFSGEVERAGSPVETALRKCELALEETGFDLALASEGSFGPHPLLFGVPIDEELVYLYDRSQTISCIGKSITTETNFYHAAVNDVDAVVHFANAVQFPSHGIILKNAKESPREIIKGIRDYDYLISTFNRLKNRFGSVYAETDMRAMHNPTRMKVIEQATLGMIATLTNRCPKCRGLNFSVADIEYGLPCSSCGTPTKSVLAHHYYCSLCSFNQRKLFPKLKEVEDPQYCDYCNP